MGTMQNFELLPLPFNMVEYLSYVPENGNGCHILEVLFDDGSILKNVVVRSLVAEIPLSHAHLRIVEVRFE